MRRTYSADEPFDFSGKRGAGLRPEQEALPTAVRRRLKHCLGADLSGVRVHAGPARPTG